jgi:hypothetical protein
MQAIGLGGGHPGRAKSFRCMSALPIASLMTMGRTNSCTASGPASCAQVARHVAVGVAFVFALPVLA